MATCRSHNSLRAQSGQAIVLWMSSLYLCFRHALRALVILTPLLGLLFFISWFLCFRRWCIDMLGVFLGILGQVWYLVVLIPYLCTLIYFQYIVSFFRRALRAIVILIPLLGLQYILFPFKPPPRAPGEHIYAMISAFLVSFQVCMILALSSITLF